MRNQSKELVDELLDAKRTVSRLHQQVSELINVVAAQEQIREKLQSDEEQFSQFVLSISDHIYVTEVTSEQKFVNLYLSPQVEELTGYPLEKLHKDWSFWALHIIHPDDRGRAAVQAATLAKGENSQTEYRLKRADDTIIWVRDSATVRLAGNTKIVYGLVSNISEQKEREIALTKLLDISQALVGTQNPNFVLQKAVKAALDIIPVANYGSLQLFDPSENTLRTVVTSKASKNLEKSLIFGPRQGIAGHALAQRQVINVPNVSKDKRFIRSKPASTPDFSALLVAPLVVKQRPLGTLSLTAKNVNAFTKSHQALIQLIADQIAATLENVRLLAEHKKVQTSLLESEDKYQTLTDQLPIGVYRTTESGEILYANPALAAMLDFNTVDELLQSSVWDYFDNPQDRQQLLSQWRAAGGVSKSEFKIRLKNGQEIWVRDSGQVFLNTQGQIDYIDGTMEDITEYKLAQEALATNEARFRSLVQNVSDIIAVVNEKGRIQYVSTTVERIFGYNPEQLINQRVCDYVDPDDLPKMEERFDYILQHPGITSPTEFKIKHVNGHWIWVESISNNLLDDPAVGGVVVTARDISERKQAEEQLNLLETQFRQAQKMEAIGRLAGGVAHDFNNLLTVIASYTEFLRDALDEDSPLRGDVEQIRKAGDRAAELTRQLLVFSQREIIQPQALNVNTVVNNIEKMLRRLISEDIELTVKIDPNLGLIRADPGQIEQVIMNLAVNATDAMPQGGKLTIATANVTLDESYTPRSKTIQPGPYIQLKVSDTGIGMDEETLAVIFDPFFTTKIEDKGTGLGLSAVYGIVSQNGGDISIYSAPGRGTTAYVYLPQIAESTQTPGLPAPEPSTQVEGQTILLVEDEHLVRQMARRILTGRGYTVIEARHGNEALNLCKDHPERIDLLLTDVVMPGEFGGRELAERCVACRPELKVIFMSGYADETIEKHGVLATNLSFLQKPFTPDMLLKQIAKTLNA